MADSFPPPASEANRAVLAYLADKSAHSDITTVLEEAVAPLGDVQLDCPDWQRFRYVTASTHGLVFGFAIGMGMIAFRLDARMRERALATGARPVPECGPDWVAVLHNRSDGDWPAVDVRFWALRAYVHARETTAR